MKKRLLLLGLVVMLAFSAFALVGCGDDAADEAEIRAVTDEFFAALNAGDVLAADAFIVGNNDFEEWALDEGELDNDALDLLNAYFYNGVTYTITDVDITGNKFEMSENTGVVIGEGDEARVTLELATKNASRALEGDFVDETVAYLTALIEDSEIDTIDEDSIDAEVQRLMVDALRNSTASESSKTVVATFIKLDGKWSLAGDDVFMSNLAEKWNAFDPTYMLTDIVYKVITNVMANL